MVIRPRYHSFSYMMNSRVCPYNDIGMIMPVSVEFQNDDRIAIITWENPVTQDDFMQAFAILEPIYRAAQMPVHSIHLADKLTNLPTRAISTFLNNPRSPLVHPMAGVMIVVSTKLFIRAITDTAAKMRSAGKLLAVSTLEEALARTDTLLQTEGASESAAD